MEKVETFARQRKGAGGGRRHETEPPRNSFGKQHGPSYVRGLISASYKCYHFGATK